MKNLCRKIGDLNFRVTFAIFMALSAFQAWIFDSNANAANIGATADKVTKQLDQVKALILGSTIIIGIILIALGIIKLTKRQQEDGGVAKAIIFLVAGTLMVAIGSVVSITSSSIFETEAGLDIKTK